MVSGKDYIMSLGTFVVNVVNKRETSLRPSVKKSIVGV